MNEIIFKEPATSETIPMYTTWQDRITSTPEILKGKPCIANTRIPVSLILGFLAAGSTADDIIAEYPDLTADDIAACLDYARALADFEIAV